MVCKSGCGRCVSIYMCEVGYWVVYVWVGPCIGVSVWSVCWLVLCYFTVVLRVLSSGSRRHFLRYGWWRVSTPEVCVCPAEVVRVSGDVG